MSIGQTKICTVCNASYGRKPAHGSDVAWEATKYCSRKCFGIGRRTHGHTSAKQRTPTYGAWINMRTRCCNPNSTQYAWYGARGITIHSRWLSYENFLSDMGERPSPKHSLDRFPDVNGNYEPGNVRWATSVDQARNKRSNRAVIRDDGQKFGSLSEAAEAVSGTTSGIWDVCSGKGKTHRGYSWRYA